MMHQLSPHGTVICMVQKWTIQIKPWVIPVENCFISYYEMTSAGHLIQYWVIKSESH